MKKLGIFLLVATVAIPFATQSNLGTITSFAAETEALTLTGTRIYGEITSVSEDSISINVGTIPEMSYNEVGEKPERLEMDFSQRTGKAEDDRENKSRPEKSEDDSERPEKPEFERDSTTVTLTGETVTFDITDSSVIRIHTQREFANLNVDINFNFDCETTERPDFSDLQGNITDIEVGSVVEIIYDEDTGEVLSVSSTSNRGGMGRMKMNGRVNSIDE